MNLSDRFDRGEHSSNDPDEQKILREYTWLQNKFHHYPVPEYDRQVLVSKMEQEYKRLLSKPPHKNGIAWRIFIVRAAAVFLVLLSAAALYEKFLFSSPIVNIETISISKENNDSFSWWSTYRLRHGWLVITPPERQTRLQLQDSSTLLCSPNTAIRVDYSRLRLIELRQGEILVHATSIKDATLIVRTPNLTTEVIGTVFRVKYYR